MYMCTLHANIHLNFNWFFTSDHKCRKLFQQIFNHKKLRLICIISSATLYMYIHMHMLYYAESEHELISTVQVVLGERKTRPSVMDQELVQSVLASQADTSFSTIAGATMCTDDFFEGEGGGRE